MLPSIFSITTDDALYEQALALRQRILRTPLGLDIRNDNLDAEKEQVIFVYLENNKVLGCVLLQPYDGQIFKLRQMAVDAQRQREGIGAALVRAAEEYAASAGRPNIVLHARETALHFYERLGYEVIGAPFIEVGIPHRKMEKCLMIN